jgi:hypothetical protein
MFDDLEILLLRMDQWYAARAQRYTPQVADGVLAPLLQAHDDSQSHVPELVKEYYVEYVHDRFTYNNAQERASHYFSNDLQERSVTAQMLEEGAVEHRVGSKVYEASVVPYIELVSRMEEFVSVCNAMAPPKELTDEFIDGAFVEAFGGLGGFLRYDRELYVATVDMQKATIPGDPHVVALDLYREPLLRAHESYNRAVFADLPVHLQLVRWLAKD